MNSSSTSSVLVLSTESNSGSPEIRAKAPSKSKRRLDAKIVKAVYMHIRAIRTLGKSRVDTVDIAQALNVSVDDVNRTLRALRKKGVKKVNG
jgi:hypothetical protein